jgi:hypothetical protein
MEKRKDKRFGERNRVFIKDNGQNQKTAGNGGTYGHTHDISISGVQIRSKLDYPVGQVIHIVIDLRKDNRPLQLDGRVVWTRKSKNGKSFEIGVEFLHSRAETILSLIKNFYGKPTGMPSAAPRPPIAPSGRLPIP